MIDSATKCILLAKGTKKSRKVNLNETELFGSSLGRAEKRPVSGFEMKFQ